MMQQAAFSTSEGPPRSATEIGGTMHVITDLSATEGAQTMLSRLVDADPSPVTVISLRRISERNRQLLTRPNVRQVSLSMGGALDFAPTTVALARLIEREQPSAVLCWLYHAMIVGIIAGRSGRGRARVFWTIRQSLDDPTVLSRNTRLAMAMARRMSGMCDGIIYNSARALSQHTDRGFHNRNVTVIPNGFDLPESCSRPARVGRVIGIAGRFHPQKDHLTFLRAAALVAARHPAARFVAAGRGLDSANAELRTAIAAVGLEPCRIALLGEVDDMASFYRSIDLFVLSSRTEGSPNVIGEAMSHGLPVVTTDVGDAAMLVGKAGLVVPSRDPAALARAVETIMQLDADDYAILSRSAREQIAKHFGMSATASRYRRFLAAS